MIITDHFNVTTMVCND